MRQQHSQQVVALVAILCTLLSCSDEQFTSSIASLEQINLYGYIQQENVTRANDQGFVSGDRMGIFIVDYHNGQPGRLAVSGNRADNYTLTLDSVTNQWTGNGALYWKDNQTAIDIYGYYPYENAMESMTEHVFSVQADQSTKSGYDEMSGYEKSDFLWAKIKLERIKNKVWPACT